VGFILDLLTKLKIPSLAGTAGSNTSRDMDVCLFVSVGCYPVEASALV
jgi:hypothetical protein